MIHKKSRWLALWAVLIGLAFPAACGSSGVVGGECAADYIDCNGQCVDAQNDPANCGGCQRACADGVSCSNAMCEGTTEGGAGTSGNGGAGNGGDSGAGGDSGSGNGVAGDDDAGNLSDAHPDGDAACLPPYNRPSACGDCQTQCPTAKPVCSPDGMGSFVCVPKCTGILVECGNQCVDPATFDTADSCGSCDNKCPPAAPSCSPDGVGSFQCVLNCDDPLKACNGQCVDFNIDANNCGSCGNVCPSGICQAGMCVGATPGNEVAVCMDYQTAAADTPQTVLLGNAVFLPRRKPLRILAYTQYTSPSGRAKVDQAVGFAGTALNRMFSITALDNFTKISAQLSITKFDTFLIYDQTAAPPGQMATVGAAWHASSVLDSFAAAGGTIVVLSGGTTEMDQFLSSSQLLDVSAQAVVTGQKLYNWAGGNVVGSGVLSPFLAPASSCTFTTTVTTAGYDTLVIGDSQAVTGAPVVVHRLIVQP